MSGIEIETTCPLGHECEEVVDGKIRRCAWYVQLAGKNPQSEEYMDEWRCAMAWQPILMVENAQTNRGQTQAIESFRNNMIQQNSQLLNQLRVPEKKQEERQVLPSGTELHLISQGDN